jgi:hypothetical protein
VSPHNEDLSAYRPVFSKTSPVAEPDKNTSRPDTPVTNSGKTTAMSGHVNENLQRIRSEIALSNKNLKFAQGYKVQLYSGTSREEANKIINDFKILNLNEKPELSYDPPNYKVRVGNFFNKTDAHRLYIMVRNDYPNAILIADRISIVLDSQRRD